MSTTVRICVCGDEGTGKSSLIVSLVKDTFVTQKIQSVLPPVTIPPYPGIPEDVVTTIVDTSARPQDRTTLRREIHKCNVILLVYSSSYSFERVALFWLPYFRSLCVNVPVVLCANKSDLQGDGTISQVAKDEMLPVMNEFKEIDSCIRTSAREHRNVAEVFYLCQKAVTNPIGPLFDHKKGVLKTNCVTALKRIFYLSDKDQDGLLDDVEMQEFQRRCFGKSLAAEDLENIKLSISKSLPNGNVSLEDGIDLDAFLQLNKIYVENGRHETIWTVLRKYRYSDSLSLEEKFVRPKFDVPPFASAELSPAGYRFLVDLFLLFDKDNDGGLNDEELNALFRPTPGIPDLWSGEDLNSGAAFPRTTVKNESGHVTLQGWLAQWSMSTFLEPKTTLEYLAYLGFGDPAEKEPTSAALKVTKPRKRTRRVGKVERTVVLCYLVGKSYSGKSSLLNALLNRPFDTLYNPTREVRRAVNSVELPGGKQCYLILEELGPFESATLDNQGKLDACDLVCYTYDSSDPDSFAHVVSQSARHKEKLEGIPAVFAALKADRDKSVQNSPLQPDAYTASLGMSAPRHVSVTWDSISELFVALAETATNPSLGLPKSEDGPQPDRTGLYMAAGAAAAVVLAVFMVWRRATIASSL